MLKEYRTIIKSQAIWIVLITFLGFGFAYLAGYVGGENSQLKIRMKEKQVITDKLYIHMDSVNVHYLDMERNGCFNMRTEKKQQTKEIR